MNLTYRKLDRINPAELRFVAEQDSKIPLQYDSEYSWNDKSIDNRLDYYKRISDDDFFEVAELDRKIIGFHLIHKAPYPPEFQIGIIATLWVDPNFRGKGIGSELKARGEKWARDRKLKFLQTGVHPSNVAMLDINKKSGFEIVQYSLRKKL